VLGSSVEVTHESASLGAGHSFADVYLDSFHRGEIDYDATIAHPEPEPAVASGTHRQWQMLSLGKIERARDIGGATAAHDHRGTPIERAVED
jgi:hypothetical protein